MEQNQDAKTYYTGMILHALILKDKNLTADSAWGSSDLIRMTKKMCKVADTIAQEMVKIQEDQEQ